MDQQRYFEGIKRIKKFAYRAQNGEELSIGFFGGSITQGSLATSVEKSYSYRVKEWFEKKWPKAKFNYINGGIGGTTSHFGVARVHKDMLMYRPDLIVVDFSVNDEPNEFFKETYEGLIRKIWYAEFEPAVILLNNVFYDTGETAELQHVCVGDHYEIPHVSIKDTVYKQLLDGKYTLEEITPDGLHPNDFGHSLLAEEIITSIETILAADEVIDEVKSTELVKGVKKPITMNGYENCVRHTIENSSPILAGFTADVREKEGHLDLFKNGWIGKKTGDRIIFFIEASSIAVQYRKTVNRPSAIAKLIVDDDSENEIILDGNFEEDWGDSLYIETILHHAAKKPHKIEIEIIKDHGLDSTPFYLSSIIAD